MKQQTFVCAPLIAFPANLSGTQCAATENMAPSMGAKNPLAVAIPVNIYGGNKRADRPEGGFYVRMDESTSKTLDAASGLNPTCSQGGTAVIQPISIHPHCIGRGPNAGPQGKEYLLDGSAYCMDGRGQPQAVAQPIGGSEELTASVDLAGTIQRGGDGGRNDGVMTPNMQVRRLTPVECERLQGFPDGYTNIPWRNKPDSPDGPRYKALGNSWAVPVVKWIGERIKAAL
jgi:site-specific DNA-cytosine methylase